MEGQEFEDSLAYVLGWSRRGCQNSTLTFSSFSKKINVFFCYVYEYFACIPNVCLVPTEARRGCQIKWSWSYGWS